MNLWKENFEQLESKISRKVWTKIVEELNAQFSNNCTVDKCMHKMKYIIDKYKEKKDWNRKQTGGNLRKSQFYDEIDEILGCRDLSHLIMSRKVVQVPAQVPVAAVHLCHPHHRYWLEIATVIMRYCQKKVKVKESSTRKGEVRQPITKSKTMRL